MRPEAILGELVKKLAENKHGAYLRDTFAGEEDIGKFMSVIECINNIDRTTLNSRQSATLARTSFILLDYASYESDMNIKEDKSKMKVIAETVMKNSATNISHYGSETIGRVMKRIGEALDGTTYKPAIDSHGNFTCQVNVKEKIAALGKSEEVIDSGSHSFGGAAGGGGRAPSTRESARAAVEGESSLRETRDRSDSTEVAVGVEPSDECRTWVGKFTSSKSRDGATKGR